MVRHEHRVGPDGLGHLQRHGDGPPPRLDRHDLPVLQAQPPRQDRVHLARRARGRLHQELDAARLRAAQVVEHAAPAGEVDRVLRVGHLEARPVRRRVEVEEAVGVVAAAVLEQPRRAGVVLRRARPENPHLVLHALPGDAGVVGRPARAGAPQLVEDLLVVAEGEQVPRAQAARQLQQDPRVRARVARRVHRGPDAAHPPLRGGRRALLLLVQRAGQHHVGVARRLAHEEVDHAQEIHPPDGLAQVVRVGVAHHRVAADVDQAAHLARVDRLEHLHRRLALVGELLVGDPPHAADVRAVLGVLDVAVAGQLVALVAVLAPALPVALPGDGAVAASGPADAARGQHQVDQAQHVLHALGVLFHAAGVQQEARPRRPPHARHLADQPRLHAADARGPLRRAPGHRRLQLLPSAAVVRHELVVHPVVGHQLVQQGLPQRAVRAGAKLHVQVGGARDGRHPGVHHDQPRAVVPRAPDVVRQRGEALAHVRPREQHHLRQRQVRVGVRGAVHAEGLLVAAAGRHHAEAAVVVQVGRPDGQAGELAHEVALLVGQRHAAHHAEGVAAVLLLDGAYPRRHQVQRLVPRGLAEAVVGADERVGQPVGMVRLHVALHPLGAEAPLVEGEVLPRLETDHLPVLHGQLDAALHPAEAAVGLHQLVRVGLGEPARHRRIRDVRPVPADVLLGGHVGLCHGRLLSRTCPAARASARGR